MSKLKISLSDDFDEWESLGFSVCKHAGLDPNSIVPLTDGTFIIAFDHRLTASQEQKLTQSFRTVKHLAWKFENLEKDAEDYLGLGNKFHCYKVIYRK